MQKSVNTFEGGLVKIDNKTKQPKNSYSFALNATINDTILDSSSRANEKGFDPYITVRSDVDYNVIGYSWLGKEQYVFFIKQKRNDVTPFNQIWYIDKENSISRLVYSNIGLNFQDTYEINSTYRINYNNERLVYWVDGLNDDRVINIDDLTSVNLDIDLIAIQSNHVKASSNIVVSDIGGSLLSGQYFVALQYGLGTSFTTTPFAISNPISIATESYFDLAKPITSITPSVNKQFGNTDGDIINTPTKKSLIINLSNLDTNFDFVNIIVVRNNDEIRILKNIRISNQTSLSKTYTRSNGVEDTSIDLSTLIVENIKYYGSEIIGQKENRLIRGNSKIKASNINYQQFANNIKVGYNITSELVFEDDIINYRTFNSPNPLDPKDTLYQQHSIIPNYLAHTADNSTPSKSFMRDEVYSLGVGFELIDGTETDVFHIPGKTADSTFANNLVFWQSSETYPTDYSYPSGFIRHHKIPSDIQEPIYSTVITGDPNVANTATNYKIYKRTLGLSVYNVEIPDAYKSIIKKIKIYYTPRNASNKSILSKGLLYALNTTVSPNRQSATFNETLSTVGTSLTKFEFVSPEVNFGFKQTNLSGSKVKVCGIDKGYVTYMGSLQDNIFDPTQDINYVRLYNNELKENKSREQALTTGICFYNQRAIPKSSLGTRSLEKIVYVDNNFVGSTEGFGLDFTGSQNTSVLELDAPLLFIPSPSTNTINLEYPELQYPTIYPNKPSSLYKNIEIYGNGTLNQILDLSVQTEINYDSTYYVSIINEATGLYGQIENLQYVDLNANITYDGSTSFNTISVNYGDTNIDVHHFKKTYIKLRDNTANVARVFNNEYSNGIGNVKDINEFAAQSFGSFFVETDLNIRMRNDDSAIDKKYFPKSYYAASATRVYQTAADEEEYYNIDKLYSDQYSKLYFPNTRTQSELTNNLEDIRFTTRLLYSDKQNLESKLDNYRITRANNYRDLPLDRGPLSGLFIKQEKLYALTRDALFDVYASNQTIKAENGTNISVGTGEFFANEPTELLSITGGFGGTSSKYSIVETPYGYLYVDRIKNKCLLFNDQIKDINVLGLNEDFTLNLFKQIPELNNSFDNPITNVGIISAYDPILKRILVTKKDYKLLDLTIYKGLYNPTIPYTATDIVIKDNLLQTSATTTITTINTVNFSDWVISNINLSTNNMLVIDQPLSGSVTSTTTDGINYTGNIIGDTSLTVNQSGLTCGAKEIVTITTATVSVPTVPNDYYVLLEKTINSIIARMYNSTTGSTESVASPVNVLINFTYNILNDLTGTYGTTMTGSITIYQGNKFDNMILTSTEDRRIGEFSKTSVSPTTIANGSTIR